MAQTRFSERGEFKGDRVEAIILRRATPRGSGGGTDYDEEVQRREDRFFKDFDLEKIDSKEEFDKQFDDAKSKIGSSRPPKRSTMPTKAEDNFESFKDAMWRRFSSTRLGKNLERLKPRDIGLKSGKRVKGFKTEIKGEDAFVTVERLGRVDDKGNEITAIRVRDEKGRFIKKSDIFSKF